MNLLLVKSLSDFSIGKYIEANRYLFIYILCINALLEGLVYCKTIAGKIMTVAC